MRRLLMRISCLSFLVMLIIAPATAAPASADEFAVRWRNTNHHGIFALLEAAQPRVRDGPLGWSDMRISMMSHNTTPCQSHVRIGWRQRGATQPVIVGHWEYRDRDCEPNEGYFSGPGAAYANNYKIVNDVSDGLGFQALFYNNMDVPMRWVWTGMPLATQFESGGQTSSDYNAMGVAGV